MIITTKEALDAEKNWRLRQEALVALRKRTRRSVVSVILFFAVAALALWRVHRDGVSEQIGGKHFLLVDGTLNLAVALTAILAAIRQLWISPRDRLLLIIAEDVLAQKEEPN